MYKKLVEAVLEAEESSVGAGVGVGDGVVGAGAGVTAEEVEAVVESVDVVPESVDVSVDVETVNPVDVAIMRPDDDERLPLPSPDEV